MRKLNRFKSIKALFAIVALTIVMPLALAMGFGDVMAAGYLDKTQKLAENIWVGPQLSADELTTLKEEKITQVVNLRTTQEMQALSYDEAGILKNQSIDYHHIPVGKSLGYTPVQLSQFNEVMTAHGDEKILLHCRSGYRVNMLYAAWLIKYQGMDKADAKTKVHAWSDDAIDQLIK